MWLCGSCVSSSSSYSSPCTSDWSSISVKCTMNNVASWKIFTIHVNWWRCQMNWSSGGVGWWVEGEWGVKGGWVCDSPLLRRGCGCIRSRWFCRWRSRSLSAAGGPRERRYGKWPLVQTWGLCWREEGGRGYKNVWNANANVNTKINVSVVEFATHFLECVLVSKHVRSLITAVGPWRGNVDSAKKN